MLCSKPLFAKLAVAFGVLWALTVVALGAALWGRPSSGSSGACSGKHSELQLQLERGDSSF